MNKFFFDDDRVVLGNYTSVHTHMAYGDNPTFDFDEDRRDIDSDDVYKEVEKIEEITKDIKGLKCHFLIISDFHDGDGYAYPAVCFDEKDLLKDNSHPYFNGIPSILLNDEQIQEIVDTISEMYEGIYEK
jgi:hypothetical protein